MSSYHFILVANYSVSQSGTSGFNQNKCTQYSFNSTLDHVLEPLPQFISAIHDYNNNFTGTQLELELN